MTARAEISKFFLLLLPLSDFLKNQNKAGKRRKNCTRNVTKCVIDIFCYILKKYPIKLLSAFIA